MMSIFLWTWLCLLNEIYCTYSNEKNPGFDFSEAALTVGTKPMFSSTIGNHFSDSIKDRAVSEIPLFSSSTIKTHHNFDSGKIERKKQDFRKLPHDLTTEDGAGLQNFIVTTDDKKLQDDGNDIFVADVSSSYLSSNLQIVVNNGNQKDGSPHQKSNIIAVHRPVLEDLLKKAKYFDDLDDEKKAKIGNFSSEEVNKKNEKLSARNISPGKSMREIIEKNFEMETLKTEAEFLKVEWGAWLEKNYIRETQIRKLHITVKNIMTHKLGLNKNIDLKKYSEKPDIETISEAIEPIFSALDKLLLDQEQSARLKSDLELAKLKLEEELNTRKKLNDELAEERQVNSRLKEEISEIEKSLADEREKVGKNNNIIEILKQELEGIKQRTDEEKNQQSSLRDHDQKELELLKKSLEEATSSIGGKEIIIEKMKQELEDIKQRVDEEVAKKLLLPDQNQKETEEALERMKALLIKVEEDRDQLADDKNNRMNEIRDLQKEVQDLRSRQDDHKLFLMNAEIENLKRNLEAAHANPPFNVSNLDATIAVVEKAKLELMRKLEETKFFYENDKSLLNNEIEKLSGKVKKEKAKKRSLDENLNKLTSELEQQKSQLAEKIAEVDKVKAELYIKSAELHTKTSELDSKSAEIYGKSSELSIKDAELGVLKGELEAKTTELKMKNVELELKTAELAEIRKKLDDKNIGTKNSAMELDSRNAKLAEAIAELEEKKKKLEMEVSFGNERELELISQISKLEEETGMLKNEIATCAEKRRADVESLQMKSEETERSGAGQMKETGMEDKIFSDSRISSEHLKRNESDLVTVVVPDGPRPEFEVQGRMLAMAAFSAVCLGTSATLMAYWALSPLQIAGSIL